jgi:L-arabonate dehydrase
MNDSKPANHRWRSYDWLGESDLRGMTARAYLRTEGFGNQAFAGKPVVGICNSWSELTTEAGGFPLEFPTISLGEVLMKPTTMLYRNLMAMDVEECIRAYPLDAVVLLCGCDKTTPAQLMGAASADVPAIMVTGGPMLRGMWRGDALGSGTDTRRLWSEKRAGNLTDEQWCEIESCIARSAGHCMVMGTASTMTSVVEALGMTLTGCANIPAADSRRLAIAEESGRRAVALAHEGLTPSKVLTREAFENAICVDMAIGGSTNAIIHLVAIAGRVGIDLPLEIFDDISRKTPFITNIKPSGAFLMEDMYYAGGLPAVMKELLPLLHKNALTVTGKTVGENVAGAEVYNREVIKPLGQPLHPEGGTVILKGNLAPHGAVIKQTAASPHLQKAKGRAVVFESYQDMMARIDDPHLEVSEDSVLVLKNAGPKGAPGMPEWGDMPLPTKLLKAGVRDMIRISDARMSGTAYGTVVLHVSPESAAGGPLAVVRNGDPIELDVHGRRIELLIPEAELNQRVAGWRPSRPHYVRGYGRMFLDHILQAHQGCDFDYLRKT